jgi:hypothetical protein
MRASHSILKDNGPICIINNARQNDIRLQDPADLLAKGLRQIEESLHGSDSRCVPIIQRLIEGFSLDEHTKNVVHL